MKPILPLLTLLMISPALASTSIIADSGIAYNVKIVPSTGENNSVLMIFDGGTRGIEAITDDFLPSHLSLECSEGRGDTFLVSPTPLLSLKQWQDRKLPQLEVSTDGRKWNTLEIGRSYYSTSSDLTRQVDLNTVVIDSDIIKVLLKAEKEKTGNVRLRIQTPKGLQNLHLSPNGISEALEGIDFCDQP